MSEPQVQPSITDRVLAELREGPATLTELRELLPDLNAQQINGALYHLVKCGRLTARTERLRDGRGNRARLYELPGWEAQPS